jgi:hypothetical protein
MCARLICVILNNTCPKIHTKHKEQSEEDFLILKRALVNLDYLWAQVRIIHPKFMELSHATVQIQRPGGIGDFLEDDLEHLHQMSKQSVTKQTKSIVRFSRLHPTHKA